MSKTEKWLLAESLTDSDVFAWVNWATVAVESWL